MTSAETPVEGVGVYFPIRMHTPPDPTVRNKYHGHEEKEFCHDTFSSRYRELVLFLK